MDGTQSPDVGEVKPVQQDILIDNGDIVSRLKRWESERPIIRFSERKARHQIVEAAIKDLNTQSTFLSDEVLLMTSNAQAKINALFPQGDSDNPQEFSVQNKDSVSGEPFLTRFRKEVGGAIVAEEVRQRGNTYDVISQARIYPNGKTELTLNFTGPRYGEGKPENSGNPRIIIDSKFPRATAATFNLLAGTVKQ